MSAAMTAVATSVTSTAMEAATAVIAATTVITTTARASVEAVATVITAMMTVDIAVIIATATTVEAMTAPAMAISPVSPGTYAEEDAIVEVAVTVVPVGRACIGSVIIVSPLAGGGRTANADANLRTANGDTNPYLSASRRWHDCQAG
jgi:hypothetical protein